ncbi:hypothetical protein EDC96DRAFT_226967 [Choanephora cucurbitarum]|nr:hypothetical protein EDC96DRAFT_226967 [Choanephora cucurbitarum]
MPPKKTNAINSVVTDLIRAAAGASARDVADEDVDKYVADLILKEAEEKRKKYNAVGVKAYQPEPQKPKPNTRFLLNVVKATDSHNQAVIRTNEQNVARWRRERLERERSGPTRKRTYETTSLSVRSSSPPPTTTTSSQPVSVRGRGKVRLHESSMDKYFSKGYDPLLDIMDSDQEDEKRRKKKKHKSEKKKKSKKKE